MIDDLLLYIYFSLRFGAIHKLYFEKSKEKNELYKLEGKIRRNQYPSLIKM
jgi:hypothetical protein